MKMTVNEAGRRGGIARSAKETSEERSARMKSVATERWRRIPKRLRAAQMEGAWKARRNGSKKPSK
jgi:hypothetical protein